MEVLTPMPQSTRELVRRHLSRVRKIQYTCSRPSMEPILVHRIRNPNAGIMSVLRKRPRDIRFGVGRLSETHEH